MFPKIKSPLLFSLLPSLLNGVQAKCNIDDNFPTNGGFYTEGASGFNNPKEYDPVTGSRLVNSTWAFGTTYPTGEYTVCTGPFCSPECKVEPGCQNLMYATTCAEMRFCYEKNDDQSVWKLPDQEALDNCDFSNAEEVCDKKGGSKEGCCNYQIEDDVLGDDSHKMYYFASKEGCDGGMKLAVYVQSFESIADACYDKGIKSSRIRACTCPRPGLTTTVIEPCYHKFKSGCEDGGPPDGEDAACCNSEMGCVPKIFDIKTKIGKKYEKDRKKQCENWRPGRCMNDGENPETRDCCTMTCEKCGIKKHPFSTWAPCTPDAEGNMNCGTQGKFGPPDVCDHSLCTEGDHWHPEGDAYKAADVKFNSPCYGKENDWDMFLYKAHKSGDSSRDKTMSCGKLRTHKKKEKICSQFTKFSADHKPAQSVCMETCESCEECYENKNSFFYSKKKGKPEKCSKLSALSPKKLAKVCEETETKDGYGAAKDVCPVTCKVETCPMPGCYRGGLCDETHGCCDCSISEEDCRKGDDDGGMSWIWTTGCTKAIDDHNTCFF